MARKRPSVSDMIQEKVQNTSTGESVIDITAKEITQEESFTELEITVKQLQEHLENTRENQEKLQQQIQELQSILSTKEATIKNLQSSLETMQNSEENLRQKVQELQSALSEKDVLIERLNQELQEAKQAALKLAEANSKLMEEAQLSKKQKEISKPVSYKKSYRAIEKIPPTQPQAQESTDSADSAPMWLLD